MEESKCGLCGMRHRIVIITIRWDLIAMRVNPRSAETAAPGGIWERPARIGAKRIGQSRNRYRSVAGRSKSKRRQQMSFRGWVTFRAASHADAKSRTAEPRRIFC